MHFFPYPGPRCCLWHQRFPGLYGSRALPAGAFPGQIKQISLIRL